MNRCGKFWKQSVKNFRRFQILGARGTLSVCLFFIILKTLLFSKETVSQNLQAISKELLDFYDLRGAQGVQGPFFFYKNIIKVLLCSNEALCKFWKQLVKNFRSFQTLGPPRGPESHSFKRKYKNTPVKKYILKILMCSNAIFCQTLNSWRRILGNLRFWWPSGGPRNTLCLYIF